MTSSTTSGRLQIAETCSFLVMFGSQFLDNGLTDLEKVYSFGKGDSSALSVHYINGYLPLDKAIASRAVFVIVSESDGWKIFCSQLNNSKTVRDRP